MTDHDADVDAKSIEKPKDGAPDEGQAYDPEMTDVDEANIPPESDVDPDSDGETHEG